MPGLNLTREEAQQRGATVKPKSYQVELDLTTGDRVFASTTTIKFAAEEGASTFADLVADEIMSITLNDQPVDLSAYNDNRIALADLQASNTLKVEAKCIYMHTGEGLHSFVDPQDGERYTYSQFEVPDARRVFTTFEQPDLKATFEFSVTTPAHWTVFSNSATPAPKPVDGKEDTVRFDFAPSHVISSYITAIVAGPYVGKTSSLTSSDGRTIPLGVYCRKSLEEHLDADNIFDVTKKGFKFFENAYGIAYPFDKYDQIFVPEYNAGAMENAGCVTFRDQYIFRSKPTAWDLENRANTILHELAHMWFGDLVTMKWWNDLWLNESFAEYMSHLALAEGTEWTDAWIGFMSRKEWGLNQDQLPSTHPIKADIRDLEDVEVNFDGITYAKGASVLRQLVTYVGKDQFFKGLNQYLTKHSYANATLDDLLGELEKASGRDLRAWSKVWLEEAGVTLLRPQIELNSDGTYKKVDIKQESFNANASLRPHRLIVAGYNLKGDKIVRDFSYEIDVEGESTAVKELVGKPKADLLLINDQDLAYVKLRLDPDSLDFALENIDKFEDALTRRVILSCAWDMVRDGELSATKYIELALRAIPVENSIATLTALLARVQAAVSRYTAAENRAHRASAAADRLVLAAQAAPAETDQQRLLVQALAAMAVTEDQLKIVEGIYGETSPLHGLDLDLDMRWDLLFALVAGGLAGETAIDEMRDADPSLTGEQNVQEARASIDSDDVRATTWDIALHDVDLPNDTRWAMLSGFWSHATTKPAVYTEYVEKFFDEAARVWKAHTFHMASGIIETAFPSILAGYIPGVDVVTRAQEWLDNHTDQPDSLRRLIIEGQADAQRMLVAQRCDAIG